MVRAGSVLEDSDQRGLAHFVEHMAFNGATHFEKFELVNFLQRSGVAFGSDLNAYTSFNETVYELMVPTDSGGLLAQGLQILEDWAHQITFDTAAIRQERGGVLEEWRIQQGIAAVRVEEQLDSVRFHGSRYADHSPVGTQASLETSTPSAITRFYRDWYRPDLMAVVVMGDFDQHEVERLIRWHFAGLQAPAAPRPRPQY